MTQCFIALEFTIYQERHKIVNKKIRYMIKLQLIFRYPNYTYPSKSRSIIVWKSYIKL